MMIIESNVIERHPVEAAVLIGSPVSQIVVAVYPSEHIKWVPVYVL
jgi:hypothetical protein